MKAEATLNYLRTLPPEQRSLLLLDDPTFTAIAVRDHLFANCYVGMQGCRMSLYTLITAWSRVYGANTAVKIIQKIEDALAFKGVQARSWFYWNGKQEWTDEFRVYPEVQFETTGYTDAGFPITQIKRRPVKNG